MISNYRGGFGPGYTAITIAGEAGDDTGISMGVLQLAAGESHVATLAGETAFLLMDGAIAGSVGGLGFQLSRASLFDDSPACLHAAAGTPVEIRAEDGFRAHRLRLREPGVLRAARVPAGRRRGRASRAKARSEVAACGSCARSSMRTTRRPKFELVLGEVVTLPGGWSSYPPHHHPQPEIYHYRFTHPQGYGHAEHGDEVFKVRQYDTIRIPAGHDHAQCAAPGYGMYYAWVIRHLPGKPYDVPEFTAEHAWTMKPGAKIWEPPPRPDAGTKVPAKPK